MILAPFTYSDRVFFRELEAMLARGRGRAACAVEKDGDYGTARVLMTLREGTVVYLEIRKFLVRKRFWRNCHGWVFTAEFQEGFRAGERWHFVSDDIGRAFNQIVSGMNDGVLFEKLAIADEGAVEAALLRLA